MAASGLTQGNGTKTASPVAPQEAGDKIAKFVGRNAPYYRRQFGKLGQAKNYTFTFNWAAAIFGPLWWGARNLWGQFWAFLFVEVLALVPISRGLTGGTESDKYQRAQHLSELAASRFEEARQAAAEGAGNAEMLRRTAEAFERGAEQALQAAEAAQATGLQVVAFGIASVILVRAVEGALANWALERRLMKASADPNVRGDLRGWRMLLACVFTFIVVPLTLYVFSAPRPVTWLASFPSDRDWFVVTATAVDKAIGWITIQGAPFFDGVTGSLRAILRSLEAVLIGAPWPVVMLGIIVLAWTLAGRRFAIFAGAALAYLALLGLWEKSMATVALLGTAAFICVAVGIPLGILCAKSAKVYGSVRPVLDFMQTTPAFVYLIPIIAFFGTGKPPGAIATIIFGMPPVVRLTALGLQGVPASVREAVIAFGASKRFLLFNVELPLAKPSIMTGINQTILMCLSMVVIASLIGAKGLGEEVLQALQYAAAGRGILAGLAILFCAILIDRIVQGKRASHGDA